MNLTEGQVLAAAAIMVDDWIDIAGHTFRVKNTTNDGMFVTFELYSTIDPDINCELKVHHYHPIEFRNQK